MVRLQKSLILLLALLASSGAVATEKDYYKVLGVSKKATTQDIKSAYRKLAVKWHPDRNRDNREKAEKKFSEIAQAYEVLSDSEARKEYDLSRASPRGTAGENAFHAYGPGTYARTAQRGGQAREFKFNFRNAEDIFKEFFGDENPFESMGTSFGFDANQGMKESAKFTGSQSTMQPERLKSILRKFYAKHTKKKPSAQELDKLAQKYSGREAELYKKLQRKYGVAPKELKQNTDQKVKTGGFNLFDGLFGMGKDSFQQERPRGNAKRANKRAKRHTVFPKFEL